MQAAVESIAVAKNEALTFLAKEREKIRKKVPAADI